MGNMRRPLRLFAALTMLGTACGHQGIDPREQPATVTGTAVPQQILKRFTVTFASSSTSGMPMPSTSDAYSTSTPNPDSNVKSGIVNYYFVFIAILLCLASGGCFLIWKRKKMALMRVQQSRVHAYSRDVTAAHRNEVYGPYRLQRYWPGRGRSTEDVGREEGLNEHGEAPPAYVPKTAEEQAREVGGEPAIPMHTLAREDVGHKPPDYAEISERPADGEARNSSASGEGSSTALGSHTDG